jgi:CheY-like chemotaxis protein
VVQPSSLLRVLIVDDHSDQADSLALLVRLWGHEALVAYSGPAALELATTYCPHAVILDLALPGTSGLEVAHQLRQRPELGATALIAITGLGDVLMRRRAYECGIEAFLVKPADPNDVREELGRIASQALVQTVPFRKKRTKKMRVLRPMDLPETAAAE